MDESSDAAKNYFAELKQKIEAYIQDRILLLKLQTVKRVSKLIAVLFAGLILFFLLLSVLLFLSIALSFYFASLVHSTFGGFGIVAFIYLVLFFIVIKFRKRLIEKPIVSIITKILFDK